MSALNPQQTALEHIVETFKILGNLGFKAIQLPVHSLGQLVLSKRDVWWGTASSNLARVLALIRNCCR